MCTLPYSLACSDSRLRLRRRWSTAMPMVGASLAGMPASCRQPGKWQGGTTDSHRTAGSEPCIAAQQPQRPRKESGRGRGKRRPCSSAGESALGELAGRHVAHGWRLATGSSACWLAVQCAAPRLAAQVRGSSAGLCACVVQWAAAAANQPLQHNNNECAHRHPPPPKAATVPAATYHAPPCCCQQCHQGAPICRAASSNQFVLCLLQTLPAAGSYTWPKPAAGVHRAVAAAAPLERKLAIQAAARKPVTGRQQAANTLPQRGSSSSARTPYTEPPVSVVLFSFLSVFPVSGAKEGAAGPP